MLPAITATQIQLGLEDFLRTNFSISSPYFSDLIDEFIENGNAFRGPYLSLGLPFAEGLKGRDCFPELDLKFPPYMHQENAFDRLSGDNPESTLVATGTGSGKTECFLYPILDYCRRNSHKRGIKAILIYPMNALATDQASRIAKEVNRIASLKGNVRAGLYVGQREASPKPVMGESHVITDKNILRQSPPDILLTNYKMLDYLLLRHQDRDLWEYNEPDTLRFLVVDELHTFDGAQGTDLACLIRRLKARLSIPKEVLCCVGTSATLGSDSGAANLLEYADNIFGEKFAKEAVITEHRVSGAEFLGESMIRYANPPKLEDMEHLDPDNYATPLDYIRAQYVLWFDELEEGTSVEDRVFRVRLGEELKEHLFFQNLVRGIKGKIKNFDQLMEIMRPFFRGLKGEPQSYHSLVLISLLSLISHARRKVVSVENGVESEVFLPLMNVRLQHWLRELRRMVVSVRRREENFHPVLRFSSDLAEDDHRNYLPLVHCRECGASGWLGLTNVSGSEYRTGLTPIYSNFFSKNGSCKTFFPDVDEVDTPDSKGHKAYICGTCRAVSPNAAEEGTCKQCHSSNIVKVFIPDSSSKYCPFCRSRSSMLLLGAQAASLTSAIISQLFASSYNDDKKLITFSDNVQDASHRAGFFGARTYSFTLRSAIQQCLQEYSGTICLADFPGYFSKFWNEKMDVREYIATFIHPSMEWRYEYDDFKQQNKLPEKSRLKGWIDKRLGWEIYSNYSLNSRIGRTLEKTSSSIAGLDPDLLQQSALGLTEILANEIDQLRDITFEETAAFIAGLVAHMRQNGAVQHPVLDKYIEDWGKDFRISQQRISWMPSFGFKHKTPKMLTNRFGVEKFEQVFIPSKTTWCVLWAQKNFKILRGLGSNLTQSVYDKTLAELVRNDILEEFEVDNKGQKYKVWSVNPAVLLLSTDVQQFKCSKCGHEISAPGSEVSFWQDTPCHRLACLGSYSQKFSEDNFYGKLYSSGQINRLFTAEHTGLLGRDEREEVEDSFKLSHETGSPWDPNLLSCTPTLEMGIDIGNLSSTIQCSVPPSQSNYLQRIGRAGRKDGNALNITIANAKPHDLYFFESPEIMMEGDVEPPGVFLNASAVLERQLTAFCLDRWVLSGITVQDMPDKLVTVLSALEKRNESAFPYNFLKFIENGGSNLLDRFLEIFEGKLSVEAQAHLKRFIHGTLDEKNSDVLIESPLSYKIIEGLGRILKSRDSLRKKANKAKELLKKMEADPAKGKSTQERIDELRREVAGLRKLASMIGQKNVFNFFTDEGLLPNYAFPEQGVTLHSVIYRKKEQPDGEGKNYEVNTYEYERASQNAITEFAPGNIFYAGKRKVCIDQVDIETSEVQGWRLCPDCSHCEVVTSTAPTGPCPSCGAELFADEGQKRTMLKMAQVFATTSEQRSRVADDSDSRDPQFYVRQLLVHYDPSAVTQAFKLDTKETVFGYAFLSKAVFREINFGRYTDEEEGLSVAGIETPKQGFRICALCGKLLTDNSQRTDHAWGCAARKEDVPEKVFDCVYLYREFNSEAIKILLPFTGAEKSDVKLESFIAAFNLGLKLKFGGSINHLRSTIHTEPDSQDSKLRKQYLVIYDSIPGGTGYLKELMRDDRIFEILQMAHSYLTDCRCNEKPELDGCYRCLLAYRNSTQMQTISKQSATDVLVELLNNKDKLVATDELKSISLGALFESELELRFIEALRRQNSERLRVKIDRQIVNGREGFFLEIGESRWNIEQQVDLGASQGVLIHSRADFVFTPARSKMNSLPIVIYTDGFSWHKNRVGLDLAQRMALIRSGKYHVWSLTYSDVQSAFDMKNILVPDLVRNEGIGWKKGVWDKLGLPNSCKMEGKNSLSMLIEYLTIPDRSQWLKIADTYSTCAVKPMNAAEVSLLETGISKLIPDNLKDCASLPGAAYNGWYKNDFSQLFFSKSKNEASSALYLEDTEDNLENKDFEIEWCAFFRACNLYQFQKYFAAVTYSGIESDLYRDLPESSQYSALSKVNKEDQAGWDEVAELVSDEFLPLIKELRNADISIPEVGYELSRDGRVIGEAELAWLDQKVVILSDDYIDLKNDFVVDQWEVLNLSLAQDAIENLIVDLK